VSPRSIPLFCEFCLWRNDETHAPSKFSEEGELARKVGTVSRCRCDCRDVPRNSVEDSKEVRTRGDRASTLCRP
jgi:hypothetical protein